MADTAITRGKRPRLTPIALANLDAWVRSPRVVAMLLCLLVYCAMEALADAQMMQVRGVAITLTVPELIFIKLNNGFYLMATLLFLVMISEIPRRINYQNYMLMRATRSRWVLGQCLYCLWLVLLTILVLVVFYAAMASISSGWGGGFTENALIAQGQYEEYESLVPQFVRYGMTPWTACLLAAVPLFFFWMTMVLIILVLGLMGQPLLGPMIYGVLLMAQVTIFWEALPASFPLPYHFANLNIITAAYPEQELQRLTNVLLGYVGLCAGLVGLLLLVGRRADFVFYTDNKE